MAVLIFFCRVLYSLCFRSYENFPCKEYKNDKNTIRLLRQYHLIMWKCEGSREFGGGTIRIRW